LKNNNSINRNCGRMNIEEKDIDLIEQYLEGTLKGSDLDTFNQRMEEDQEFRSSLEEMETMVSGIRYSGRRKVKQELETLEANLPEIALDQDTPVIPLFKRKWFAAAASVLIIAISALWLFNPSDSHQDLFNSYYTPYLNVVNPTLRAEQPTNIPLRDQAYQAYDRQEYQKAVDAFLSIPEHEQEVEDQLYLGISYLSLQNMQEAVTVLKTYVQEQEQFKLQAQWYLALAYIAQGESELAVPLLNQVSTERGFKAVEAQNLLQQLK